MQQVEAQVYWHHKESISRIQVVDSLGANWPGFFKNELYEYF